jgi:trigger factor
MKAVQKPLDDEHIQIDVTLAAKTVNNIVLVGTRVAAEQNGIASDDPVKTPLEVVKKLGRPQLQAFLNEFAMNSMVTFAISKLGVDIIMDPQCQSSEQLTIDKPFKFSAMCWLKPQFELSSYDPVVVKLPRPAVTNEELDEQLYAMAEASASEQELKDAAVENGDEVDIKMSCTDLKTKQPIKSYTFEKRVYKLGDGFLPQEFDEALIGMKVGEQKDFKFANPVGVDPKDEPANHDKSAEELAELRKKRPKQDIQCHLELLAVRRRVVPTINDAWVKENIPSLGNLDNLKAEIRAQGINFKTEQLEQQKMFASASMLATRFQGHIKDEFYEYTRDEIMRDFNNQLQAQKMSMDDYLQQIGMDKQQYGLQVMLQVRETLRQSFSLDALARHLKMKLTDQDIDVALHAMAPGKEEEALQQFAGTGRDYLLHEAALRIKANQWLVDTATFDYIDQ